MTNDIELRNENGKIVGYDSDGNKIPISFENGAFDSVSTDELFFKERAGIDESVLSSTGWIDLYVDPNGSDSNNGLSSSEPLQTIQEAFLRVPGVAFQNPEPGFEITASVAINLSAGSTFSISTAHLIAPWVPKVTIRGDSSSPPTISVGDAASGLWVERTALTVFDTIIDAQSTATPNRYLKARRASITLDNVTLNDSGTNEEAVHCLRQSYLDIPGNTTISGPGKGSGVGIKTHSSTHLRLDGQVSDYAYPLWLDRGSTGDLIGATLTNNSYVIRAEDGSVVKAVKGCDFSSSATIGMSINGAFINLGSGNTYPGNNTVDRRGGAVLAPDGFYYWPNGITEGGSGGPALSSAPQYADIADKAVADGSGWDPDGDGTGELVSWDGSSWQEIHDYGTTI